jgi:hypothetical protein
VANPQKALKWQGKTSVWHGKSSSLSDKTYPTKQHETGIRYVLQPCLLASQISFCCCCYCVRANIETPCQNQTQTLFDFLDKGWYNWIAFKKKPRLKWFSNLNRHKYYFTFKTRDNYCITFFYKVRLKCFSRVNKKNCFKFTNPQQTKKTGQTWDKLKHGVPAKCQRRLQKVCQWCFVAGVTDTNLTHMQPLPSKAAIIP